MSLASDLEDEIETLLNLDLQDEIAIPQDGNGTLTWRTQMSLNSHLEYRIANRPGRH